MTTTRTILHVDMDQFFAAVEVLDRPELAGKPLLVGGAGLRGVVATASYEARKFGCHSAQPMAVALRLCPAAIVIHPEHNRYREESDKVFDIFQRFTPWVEPLSIDEAFLDITGAAKTFAEGPRVAAEIRAVIKSELGLTASVGVASNKFLAKLASDLDKPDGLTVIDPDAVKQRIGRLAINKLWGVGPATERRLATLGVRTFADVWPLPLEMLTEKLGSYGQHIHQLAQGIDDRRVTPDREAKSIGHEQTFGIDIADADEVRRALSLQAEHVARRLRKADLRAKTVTVKIRYGNFETITRSSTFANPTSGTDDIWHAARELFDRWATEKFSPVRLIGVSTRDFRQGPVQQSLFDQPQHARNDAADRVTDEIAERFGKKAIRRAGSMRKSDEKL
jgi:DNA polymerase-4